MGETVLHNLGSVNSLVDISVLAYHRIRERLVQPEPEYCSRPTSTLDW